MKKWVLSCLIITLFLINPLKFSISEKNIVTKNSLHEIQEIGQYDDNYGAVICITGDNNTLYVGTNIGFLLLNRSSPTTLSYLGEIFLDERVNFVHVKDKILYGYSAKGLTIYNVSNHEEPVQIATYSTNDDLEQYHFIIKDEYGFKEIEDDNNKDNIVILNISNPQNIFEISRYVVPFSHILSYIVEDNFIYISTFDGLSVVNITDSLNPFEVAYFTAIHLYGYDEVFVDNQKMIYLISRTEHALLVLNGSDPSSLTILDEISIGGITNIIEYENNLLIETNKYYTELIVVNKTDPTNLIIESNITYGSLGLPDDNLNIKWHYDSIFYLSKTNEVILLDFSYVMNPELVGIFNCGGYTNSVGIIGNHVYLPEHAHGIEIFDIFDKTNPTKVSTWQQEVFSSYLLIEDDYIYAYGGSSDLDILEVKAPHELITIGSYRASYAPLSKVSKYGDYLYFVGGCEGVLTILNVKDKANPKFEYMDQYYGFSAIATQANKAYFLDKRAPSHLYIFDISKPSELEELLIYELPGDSEMSEIVVIENNAYLAFEDRFMVLELSKNNEVTSIQELTNITMTPMDLVITEDYAIIGCREGVKIIEIETMQEVASYYDGGSANGLAIVNNTIFVADGYDNLEILETNFELGKVLNPNTINIDIPIGELLEIVIPVVIITSLIHRKRKKKTD